MDWDDLDYDENHELRIAPRRTRPRYEPGFYDGLYTPGYHLTMALASILEEQEKEEMP
jgi:CHAD domain-containing protein